MTEVYDIKMSLSEDKVDMITDKGVTEVADYMSIYDFRIKFATDSRDTKGALRALRQIIDNKIFDLVHK